MSGECRIGSVPWFAGVFWLLLSFVPHVAARLAFHANWMWLARKSIDASQACLRQAVLCAIEGGAER